MVWTVPKVRREYFGYKGVAALPTTYPSMSVFLSSMATMLRIR